MSRSEFWHSGGVRRSIAYADVERERERQEARGLEKREAGLEWWTCASVELGAEAKLAILVEEVGEVARELCEARAASREPAEALRVELIQVAAVALAWIESLL